MTQRTHHDLDHVVSLIQSFEALPEQQLAQTTIHKYQKRLDDIATIYQHDGRAGSDRFVLYELQALLLNAQGHPEQATECLEQALAFKPSEGAFISSAAQAWEHKTAVNHDTGFTRVSVWRKVVAFIVGVVGLFIIANVLLHSTFTTRVQTDRCGFFTQCQAGNAFERKIITDAEPFNASSIVTITVVSLVYLAFLLLITRYRGQWRIRSCMAMYALWAVILGVGLGLFMFSTQHGSVVESGGSITEEEYACQLQAVKSLDNLGSEMPASCPGSAESEKYWQSITL